MELLCALLDDARDEVVLLAAVDETDATEEDELIAVEVEVTEVEVTAEAGAEITETVFVLSSATNISPFPESYAIPSGW